MTSPLIDAGDLEVTCYKDVVKFGHWWNSIEATHKVLVPGNHDFFAESNDLELFLDNTHVLNNSLCSLDINGRKICIAGTGWTLPFMQWAFMCPEAEIDKHYTAINNNADIIISHGPMYKIHDYVKNKFSPEGKNVGSTKLFDLINGLDQTKKRLFFHGHIHGMYDSRRHTVLNEVDIYNVSVADEFYKVVHEPLILEISNV